MEKEKVGGACFSKVRIMARMGGKKHMKRAAAPKTWKIPRKVYKFTIKPSPGPYPKDESYPLAVLIRDVLKLVKNYREARVVIKEGKFLVDGVVRKAPDFPIGLMSVLSIPILNKAYRILPLPNNPLAPVEIPESEKNLKLCKIKNKVMVKDGIIQYGLHDGRTIRMADGQLKPGDTFLIELPSQRIVQTFKMEPESLVLIIKGKAMGNIGRIIDIKPGSITQPKMALIKFDEEEKTLPVDNVFVIGKDSPALTMPGWVK